MATLIWLLNGLFTVNALVSYFSFIGGKRSMFYLSLFSNAYWLFIGIYYSWYANIAITIYFIIVNGVGWATWHNKGVKSFKKVWLLMALFLTVALYCNVVFGFKDYVAVLNFCNVCVYGVAYTLKLYPQHKRWAMALFTINQVVYLPTVILASPVLWGCILRQSLMVTVNITTMIWPNNWFVTAISNFKITNKTRQK